MHIKSKFGFKFKDGHQVEWDAKKWLTGDCSMGRVRGYTAVESPEIGAQVIIELQNPMGSSLYEYPFRFFSLPEVALSLAYEF